MRGGQVVLHLFRAYAHFRDETFCVRYSSADHVLLNYLEGHRQVGLNPLPDSLDFRYWDHIRPQIELYSDFQRYGSIAGHCPNSP